jgi:acetylornithine deacetylase/succinyl-diaminopimelate desuccinylase-like protein
MALQAAGRAHARCVVLIEACEESGSYDLPAYVDHLAERIGKPSLVVCLDSGCGNYDQLWCTTSLRGLAGGNLTVKVLRKACTPATPPASCRPASASCASCCRGSRTKARPAASSSTACTSRSRRTPATGRQGRRGAGHEVFDKFPFLPGMTPMARRPDRTGAQPHLAPGAVDHRRGRHAALSSAGNVLRPQTAVKLSLRLPPTLDGKRGGELLQECC